MKHGVLAQKEIVTADENELVHTFTGDAAFLISLVNRNGDVALFSIAHVPAGEILSDRHWFILDRQISNSETLPIKYLATKDDQLIVSCTTGNASVTLHGVEKNVG